MVKKKTTNKLLGMVALLGCKYVGRLTEDDILDTLRVLILSQLHDTEATRRERDDFRRRYYDNQE